MAVNPPGRTPLEQLRTHYERTRMRCVACGHVDVEGEWLVSTSGRRVRYEHACPSCGAVETQELDLH